MHEMHACIENGGQTSSAYGLSYDLYTLQGFVDWIIGDWIKISVF